ncbi:mitogen-activated protein kinase kinase kinase A-like [Cucumis melo var. makuwa]|uniref:Mitogen-activated protein kinase kinase kinase A-like n=2 Tax=Cucumis melo TaxID=3656 RepID=A0A5D3C4R6_CUCMM|nr:mitogen-activated protein kinase kinase kinase A-like [Cucumis melo var. makuwa]TYK06901.1 mitogen-activated protein kinase kinase kinase A-like [Cucumis melo var. makuwa]
MEKWVFVKVLGQGSDGVVWLAKQTIRRKIGRNLHYYFAVKLSPLRHNSSLLWEEQVLKQFKNCPEIVQYLGSEITRGGDLPQDKDFYTLKLEYAAGGTLDDLIKQKEKLPENEVKDYLRMILKGLSCVHSKGFVHVDLKPNNILAFPQSDGKMKLKIADFGHAERCKLYRNDDDDDDQDRKYGGYCSSLKFKGTPRYMSPESIVCNEVNDAHDIWSLGCVLVKMISGKSVWDDLIDSRQLMMRLLDNKNYNMPTIPKELSKQGKDFIKKCFIRNCKQRWTADMLLQHPYLMHEENEAATTVKDDDQMPTTLAKALSLSRQRPLKSQTRSSNNNNNNNRKFNLRAKNYLLPLLDSINISFHSINKRTKCKFT